MAGQPVVFQPGAVCPVGYLCIPGMEPMKLPDVQPDDVLLPTVADPLIDPSLDVQGAPTVNIPTVEVPPDIPPLVPPVDTTTIDGTTTDVWTPTGYDPAWDTMDIPAGASFDVRRGLLPTGTPTFEIHNPYYGDDYTAERGYSGSYGWRLPGGSGITGGAGGSFDPFNPWGGVDRQYGISNQYSDEPAFGTNLTPYEERWFIGNSLLPESYEDYIENITTITPSNPDIYPTTTGTISPDAGLAYPTIADSYDIQPPEERILWGNPYNVTSDVDIFGTPSFIHPYYDWLDSDDFDDMELDFEDMESEEGSDFMDGLLNSLGVV